MSSLSQPSASAITTMMDDLRTFPRMSASRTFEGHGADFPQPIPGPVHPEGVRFLDCRRQSPHWEKLKCLLDEPPVHGGRQSPDQRRADIVARRNGVEQRGKSRRFQ